MHKAEEMNWLDIFTKLVSKFLAGDGRLLGPVETVAREYLDDPKFAGNREKMIDAVIASYSKTVFSTSFVAGLGGLITLPVTIPASMATELGMQARMVGVIATMRGYSPSDVDTYYLILMCMFRLVDLVKSTGVQFAKNGMTQAIAKVSPKMIQALARSIGIQMTSKASRNVIQILPKAIPVCGGLVAGGLSYYNCRAVGHCARTYL